MISIESEERPWGRFFVVHDELTYKLKRIEIDHGGRLSYQYHNKRSEAWTIVEGTGVITLDGKDSEYEQVFSSVLRSIDVACNYTMDRLCVTKRTKNVLPMKFLMASKVCIS